MPNRNLEFILDCVKRGNIFWTYHSNMRLRGRAIPREAILRNINSAEIIEDYEEDYPLPSCLCLLRDNENRPLHAVIAMDRANKHARFITVYRPDPKQWSGDFRRRTQK